MQPEEPAKIEAGFVDGDHEEHEVFAGNRFDLGSEEKNKKQGLFPFRADTLIH
jgi:hypothetical protein